MFKNIKLPQQEKFYDWATLVFLLGQWIVIALTTVNIPFGDEWENLRPWALPKGFTFEYLFAFHNEHRIVFTKLLNYIFFYTTDWNIKYQVIFNYLIYASLVLFLISFQKKHISGATKGIWVLPFFLASPLIYENHSWAIQSVFHFCVLFGVLSIFYATREKIKNSDYWLSGILAVFSIYSLAAGLFFALITLFVLVYRLALSPKSPWWDVVLKGLAIFVLVGGTAMWFSGYQKQEGHPQFTWPYRPSFWYFYANLISLGFGFRSANGIIALGSLGVVALVLWKNLKRAFSFKQHYISLAFFASLAVLAAFGAITLARTEFGIGQAKTSRYAELGVLLVPFIGWLFWTLAQRSEKFQKGFKYFIWFICLGFAGDYSYSKYFSIQNVREEGLVCISKYYQGKNMHGDCPDIYPGPIGILLENAKKMSLSWVPVD